MSVSGTLLTGLLAHVIQVVTCLVAEGMRYLISRSRDHERLAGLYLIYTVFCTQPLNPKALVGPPRIRNKSFSSPYTR